LMATPPPPFQTSTRQGRDFEFSCADGPGQGSRRGSHVYEVKLGFGTLAGHSLVLPVSLLLKRRRSARGAGVTRQRAPGRPGGPGNVQQRLMLTYDIHKPVIYLSYTTGQWKLLCVHWCMPYALEVSVACVVWREKVVSAFF
jgi:hypothetical protein